MALDQLVRVVAEFDPHQFTDDGDEVVRVELVRQGRSAGCWAECGREIRKGTEAIELVRFRSGRLLFHRECNPLDSDDSKEADRG